MFKKVIISLAIGGSLLFLPSCASTNKTTKQSSITRRGAIDKSVKECKKVDWLTGKSIEFPEHSYLIAVGYERNRKEAENKARLEMSQIFNTKIEGVTNSSKTGHIERENGKLKLSEIQYDIDSKLKNETKSVFAGLQLSRYCKKENGTIYVLATLNKRAVLPPLKEKVRKLDSIITKLVNEAKNTGDKLQRIISLNKALRKSIKREHYNAQIAVMSSLGQTIRTENSIESIAHLLDQQLDNLNIAVSVSGEGNKTIRLAIISSLSNLNMKVNAKEEINNNEFEKFDDFNEDSNAKTSNFNSDVDVVIVGEVSFSALDRGDNYKWVSGVVNLSIKNNKTNKIYNSLVVSKRIKRLTLQEARRMTGIKLTKALIEELNENLINVIGSSLEQ